MPLVTKIDEVVAMVGQPLGGSEWHLITQRQVDLFAEATWDHQWIHVDPDRAADGPYGGTIAHGFLTVSLIPALLAEIWHVDGIDMTINRGFKELVLRAPVPVGARVRMVAEVAGARTRPRGFTEIVLGLTFEVEHDGTVAKAATAQQVLLVRSA